MGDTRRRRVLAARDATVKRFPTLIGKFDVLEARVAVDAADAAVNLGAAANVLRVYRSDKEMGSARLTELILDAALGRQSNE